MPNDVFPSLHLQIFAGEASDQLRALRAGLASLDGEHDKIAIPQILRSAHSLKGSARMLGFEDISNFCHRVEAAVSSIARGRESSVPDIVEILQNSVDLLENMVSAALAGDAMPPTDDVARRLEGFVRESEPAAALGLRLRAAIQTGTTPPEASLARSTAPNGALSNRIRQLGAAFGADSGLHSDDTDVHPAAHGMVLVSLADLDSLMQLCQELRRYDRAATTVNRTLFQLRQVLEEGSAATEQSDSGRQTPVVRRALASLDRCVAGYEHAANFSSSLERLARDLRFCHVESVFGYLPEAVKTIARNERKRGRLVLRGRHLRVERELLHAMSAPIVHMVSNAVHHGLEEPDRRKSCGKPSVGTVTLSWQSTPSGWRIKVEDDGNGIDAQLIRQAARQAGLMPEWLLESMSDEQIMQIIFRDGFTTSKAPSLASGRGLGMAIVKDTVVRLNGHMHFASRTGLGVTFTIDIPRTAASSQSNRHAGNDPVRIHDRNGDGRL